ncbi:MAG TPA: hypothetical protein VLA89_17320, partial [Gemmatimonadales bacterium]|nr:hypothetical protein [Gemmatimonadales bacterium]
MWTLTTSQKAAVENPATEPRMAVELESSDGLYALSTEPFSWSGTNYIARVTDPPRITTQLGDPGGGLAAAKTVAIGLANPDGYFSQKGSSWSREQIVTLKEIFLDVPSFAATTYAFAMTGMEMQPGGNQVQVQGEDLLAKFRQRLVPHNNVIITRSLYPNLPEGSDALGKPIPLAFGRSFVPCYLVDQTSLDVFVACVGSATWGASSLFVEQFDGGFSAVQPRAANITTPYSLNYANRFGIPVTEIVVTSGIPVSPSGFGAGAHFADLVMPQNSDHTTPDRVLVAMLTDAYAGACFDPSYIDSDSLLAANSFFRANSVYFDGALTEQQPLETWLQFWQHDC